jgi:RNA polymerase sigma factor (sigma-70 family)
MNRQAVPLALASFWLCAPDAELLRMRSAVSLDQDRPSDQVAAETRRRDSRIVSDVEARDGQALFGFVRRHGLSDSQADDAVQDVLLRLWAELQRGVIVDNPRAWAFRTIYRLAMDQHRLSRRLAALQDLLGRASRQTVVRDASDRIAVWAEVDRLPERQRQVVYLRYRADLAFDEIAEVLGITSSGARSHATQAMATLRGRMTLPDGSR